MFSQDANTPYKSTFYNSNIGTIISDSFVIGNSKDNKTSYTPDGIEIAWDRGQLIKNVAFYNFPEKNSNALRPAIIVGRCTYKCGVFINL